MDYWNWRIATLSVLLVTAGCQGYGRQTSTLTPAPIPADGPTSPTVTAPSSFPPGVSADGVENVSDLVNAHMKGLRNQSYTVRDTKLYLVENDPAMLRSETTVRTSADGRQYHYVTEVTGAVKLALLSAQHREIWSDGRQVFMAENGSCSGEGNPRAVPQPPKTALPVDSAYERQLMFIFTAVETKSTEIVTEDSTRLYRVDTTGVQGSSLSTVENFSLRAWIDEDGVIRRYQMAYLTVVDGQLLRVWETLRFYDIGTTGIRRPDWYICLEKNAVDD